MSEQQPKTGPLTIETSVYFARGAYWMDRECTWQFYDQKAAAEIYNQQREQAEAVKRSEESVAEEKRRRTATIKLAIGLLVFLVILMVGGPALWMKLDESGFIYHIKMTTVYSSDWTTGEYKACSNVNGDGKTVETYLQCDDSPISEMGKLFKVRFHGRTYVGGTPFESLHYWKCTKNGDGDIAITCWIQEKPT